METLTVAEPLLTQLIERQEAEGWTVERMADEIGISRPYWSLLRSGERPMTINVMRRAMLRFPEYEREAVAGLHAYIIEQVGWEVMAGLRASLIAGG